MVYSKVEKLTPNQEVTREEFIAYLRSVAGRKGKTPIHLTDSLERRVSVFVRECVDASFTCAYDYQDPALFELILERLRGDMEWMIYNQRHASTLTSSLRHYIKFLQYIALSQRPNTMLSIETYTEGRLNYVHAVGYERNRVARNECIKHYGCRCAVCGFDFESVYGEIGKGFIEVHHIVPIHERGGEYYVDPIKDLRPLCSNCHSMLHRLRPALSVENLRDYLNQQQGLVKQ
jgi:predicted HNH restriction endonuclease